MTQLEQLGLQALKKNVEGGRIHHEIEFDISPLTALQHFAPNAKITITPHNSLAPDPIMSHKTGDGDKFYYFIDEDGCTIRATLVDAWQRKLMPAREEQIAILL